MKLFFRKVGAGDWEWINDQVAILGVQDTGGIIAINTVTDKPVAACVLDNWTSNSVQAHFMVADKLVLKYGFLEECFDFIFNASGRKKIYGLVPGDNEKALKLNKHMGFTEKARLEEAWRDGIDYVVMELKKEDCRYLPEAA